MKKFLPIGSVVLLKESQKRIMIVGVKQKQANSDKVWDYSACLYPAFLNKINHLDDNVDTTN